MLADAIFACSGKDTVELAFDYVLTHIHIANGKSDAVRHKETV